jgi:hypothetical protein
MFCSEKTRSRAVSAKAPRPARSSPDGGERFAVKRTLSVFDADHLALELAKNLPAAMMSSQAAALSDQQLQQLMNDPQLVELGGNLYIAKMFHYIANFAFAASGTILQTIQIDSDADFQLLMILGSVDVRSGEHRQFYWDGAASVSGRPDSSIAAQKARLSAFACEFERRREQRADQLLGLQTFPGRASRATRRRAVAILNR